ncbi:MAG TPA: protein kinase, partial [Acidobacteriota bacterium]|nr:protein kinase [Acidobacteriota bacterium]
MQVALGLNKALEKGIVHFDVKPSNMMIAENDRIKIVDFGLAHTHRELESALSSIVGSPAYVAPEQIEGGILDHRCDIYSLGVSFFEMLYGYVPITGKTVQEIFTRKVNAPFPSPETLDASVPLELYEIILRMAARDPARRYGNYSEIVEDLERFRRSRQKGVPFEMAPPPESTLRMQGQLYDRPFGEVLAEIARRNLSGKLTLSWIDLCKTIHFKDGQIIAVLSNQEGERFIDLLLARQEFSGEKARKFRSASFDLFETYSSMIEEVSVENRGKLAADVYALAKEILSGMFSWEIGEFLFEEGKFPAQMNLQIDPLETVLRGVKELMGIGAIRRRLLEGNCVIELSPTFEMQLQNVNIPPADRFLLYRFQNNILFKELHVLSALSEEEFCRLVYLFYALDVFHLAETRKEEPIVHHRRYEKEKGPTAAPEINIMLEKPARINPKESPKPASTRIQSNDLGLYYYQCAVNSYESKNNWAAVEYCKKALQYRTEGKIYLLMGNALATHPSFRHEALEAYRKALELSPVDSGIQRAMGDLYYSVGSFALARSRYHEAVKLNPHDEHSKSQIVEIKHKKKR